MLLLLQAKKMAAVGAKEETFDVWMKQESDTVQALGMAYAERETIEASYRVIQQVLISACGFHVVMDRYNCAAEMALQ